MKRILQRNLVHLLVVSACWLTFGGRPADAWPTCSTCLQGRWFGVRVSDTGGFSVGFDINPYENRHFQGTMTLVFDGGDVLVFDGGDVIGGDSIGEQEYDFDIAGTHAASGQTMIIGKGEAGLVLIHGEVSEVPGGHIFEGMLTARLVDGRTFSIPLVLGNDGE